MTPSTKTTTAGRELDAMIAEKVMGIVPRDIRVKGSTETRRVWSDSPWWGDGCQTHRDFDAWGCPKEYTTDIAAAWLVVEKMRERDWAVGMCSDQEAEGAWPTGHRGTKWEVRLVALEGDLHLATAFSESLPHAICLAALKALELSA